MSVLAHDSTFHPGETITVHLWATPHSPFPNILKAYYPHHHVNPTIEGQCNIIGYALAGYAEAIFDDSAANYIISSYKASALKTNKRQSRATFASECGTINGRMMSTSIYQVTCQLSTPLHDEPLQFILAHRDTGDVKNDHHEATDALILVIGAWSAELNEEICLWWSGLR